MPDSPNGIEIRPRAPLAARLSRRAMVLAGVAVVLLVGVLIYGAEKRRQERLEDEKRQAGARVLEPARADEIVRDLRPAPVVPVPPAPIPDTVLPPLQPLPQIPDMPRYPPPEPREERKPPTAAELAAQREREAMLSPMVQERELQRALPPVPPPSRQPDSQMSAEDVLASRNPLGEPADEFRQANMQDRKTAFLTAARARSAGNYLTSTRTPQAGICEIKAGWEIPAVLEQEINSDLPGELKALVTQNVYDTATGKYLLIPQGSRLTGRYSSDVAYGQDGVQVVWDRIIYPDGSSINLDGMQGLDAQGRSGLRHDVDRHYKRLLGMSMLSSAFMIPFELAMTRNRSVLVNPGAGDAAAAAVGREISQTGAMITRRNLNVQPTIKVPVGYRFTVRVNKDMLFAAPYEAYDYEAPAKPEIRRATTWQEKQQHLNR